MENSKLYLKLKIFLLSLERNLMIVLSYMLISKIIFYIWIKRNMVL
ncbi:hypothetical protein HMPREF9094_2715 [Fusobacterium animalis ATCC 51191]|uniref:Uncharacterized protein n=1 Tax=Fusobacterium animalis ATCC 51191 TaxID=997347 RepID=F9ES10_9FUSO|nr:hypothetical protein HMPREF9094_2715 [Fusobacterium animalis ATCC 51191]